MLKPDKMTYGELKRAESSIQEYNGLVAQFTALRWDDEDGREKLRPEIGRMRKELDMEPLPGFPCKENV